MIKKVATAQLKVGMYIHDLSCDWMTHPFFKSRFLLSSENEIQKIAEAGIHEVYIDSQKGLDVKDAPTAQEARAEIEREIVEMANEPAPVIRISVAEEMVRATQIKSQAFNLVRTVMGDARLGKAIELDRVQPVVQDITESILRNPGALMGLLRIKNHDDYTFLHSVSVCTLMVAFCRSQEFDAGTIHQAGLGGLLHDTGKALVPDAILNKPAALTREEFDVIKKHPKDGYDILCQSSDIGPIPRDITLHHHERSDGSGYPDKLPLAQISTLAQKA
ncbi:MAG: HD-GYP domain-containing protein, partial [Burkholderiaceae bacterium]